MRKNKKRIIENCVVTDFAAEGKCIIKHEGEVIFVDGFNVCPGDVVKIVIQKSKKKYAEGRILQRISLSKDRIDSFCEHFGVCGGCKWQHIPYEIQLAQKNKQVIDQITRIGKLTIEGAQPILESKETQYYRNKLEYSFSNSRWLTEDEINSGEENISQNALGFHVPRRFDKVLPIKKCFLQPDPSNQIRDFFRDYAIKNQLSFYDHIAHTGFLRNLMIRTSTTGEVMVMAQFAEPNIAEIEKLLNAFKDKFSAITSLNYIINEKMNDSYFDLDPVNFAGLLYITEKMEGLTFRIGVKSFYQTNSNQAYELYKIVRDFADIKKTDLVYDLYTGTGTIANFVAKQAKKVVGIEYIDAAIDDARINSEINEIHNTAFFAGDMVKVLTENFIEENGQPDVIIVDPPRAGLDKLVCKTLLNTNARKIVYVSCNPATQARDLEILSEKYKIEKLRPVDMFPHTFHVENVVSLIMK